MFLKLSKVVLLSRKKKNTLKLFIRTVNDVDKMKAKTALKKHYIL